MCRFTHEVIRFEPRFSINHKGDAWRFLQACTLSALARGVRHEGELAVERGAAQADLARGLARREAAFDDPRAVAHVRSQEVELSDEALSHVALVRWDHIALTGDYLWSDVEAAREQFRLLRTSRFRLEAFRAALAA